MSDKVIELQNVSKSYLEGGRRHPILQNASAEIFQGEKVVVLGRSGSGKSTLLNIISGIDRVDTGHVSVNGREITAMSEHNQTLLRRRDIGFVFQFFNLIPTLTVWENVILPSELSGIDRIRATSTVNALLEEVGLRDRSDAYPDQLSGGEQQRVAIARALAHNPSIVLADEPTGNLDDETGTTVLRLLERLTATAGKTLVMVTHSEEAAQIGNRRLYLHDCQISDSRLAPL